MLRLPKKARFFTRVPPVNVKSMRLTGRSTRSLLAAAVLLTACETAQKAKEAAQGASALAEAAQNYAANAETSQKKAEARRAKGDTLAMPYTELQQLLPASVEGYEKDGDPEGQSMNMAGASYSTASQNYKKGDHYLKLVVVDYNAAYGLYGMATAFMATGFSSENADEKMGGIDLGVAGAKGWEVIRKKEKKAMLSVGVADRFFVTAEADDQENSDLLKNAVRSLDLTKLADL
jgi:predicted small secreted protein